MARAGWINENTNRSFPFVVGTTELSDDLQLPDAVVADVGIVFGPQSNYVEGASVATLTSISRGSGNYTLTFTSTAENCIGAPLSFTFAATDVAQTKISKVFSAGNSTVPLWFGYCTCGRFDELSDRIAVGQTLTGVSKVEPALLKSMVGRCVRSINIANAARTRVPGDDECECYEALPTQAPYVVARTGITGRVRFEAGYNCAVHQRAAQNAVVFAGAIGGGAGEPCDEVSLASSEIRPTSGYFDNSPRCNDTVRAINGIGGPTLTLIAGAGVVLTTYPSEHKVAIDVNMRGLSQCVADPGS